MSILNELNWPGPVEVNGVRYDSLQDATEACGGGVAGIESVKLLRKFFNTTGPKPAAEAVSQTDDATEYVVTVKGYMTKPAQPGFDFMQKWNNNVPMPLRTMVGKKVKETPGMVYMELRGEIVAHTVQHCMKCGKPITNPVSQFFGMGPECGGHNYVNPFNSDEELHEAVEKYRREYLANIKWAGWIIKSAIVKEEIYNEPT